MDFKMFSERFETSKGWKGENLNGPVLRPLCMWICVSLQFCLGTGKYFFAHVLTDGSWRICIRENTPKFSLAVSVLYIKERMIQKIIGKWATVISNYHSVAGRDGMWPDAACRSWRHRDAGRLSQCLSRDVKHDTCPCKDRDKYPSETQRPVFTAWQGTQCVV